MKKNTDLFVQTLQTYAKQQSRLQNTSLLPSFLFPISTFIGQFPWQSLLLFSFITAWFVFLFWFEFFYNFVHNII